MKKNIIEQQKKIGVDVRRKNREMIDLYIKKVKKSFKTEVGNSKKFRVFQFLPGDDDYNPQKTHNTKFGETNLVRYKNIVYFDWEYIFKVVGITKEFLKDEIEVHVFCVDHTATLEEDFELSKKYEKQFKKLVGGERGLSLGFTYFSLYDSDLEKKLKNGLSDAIETQENNPTGVSISNSEILPAEISLPGEFSHFLTASFKFVIVEKLLDHGREMKSTNKTLTSDTMMHSIFISFTFQYVLYKVQNVINYFLRCKECVGKVQCCHKCKTYLTPFFRQSNWIGLFPQQIIMFIRDEKVRRILTEELRKSHGVVVPKQKSKTSYLGVCVCAYKRGCGRGNSKLDKKIESPEEIEIIKTDEKGMGFHHPDTFSEKIFKRLIDNQSESDMVKMKMDVDFKEKYKNISEHGKKVVFQIELGREKMRVEDKPKIDKVAEKEFCSEQLEDDLFKSLDESKVISIQVRYRGIIFVINDIPGDETIQEVSERVKKELIKMKLLKKESEKKVTLRRGLIPLRNSDKLRKSSTLLVSLSD